MKLFISIFLLAVFVSTAVSQCPSPNEERTACETKCDGITECVNVDASGLFPCFCKDGFVRHEGK